MEDLDNGTVDVFEQDTSSRADARQVHFDTRNPLKLVQVDSDDEKNNTEENLLLEEDIEGSRPKASRNNVKLDYDSDSSDDGQTRREREYERAQAKKDEGSDDDMFSDDAEEEKEKEKKKEKGLKMLDMRNFERQSGIEVDELSEARSRKGKEVTMVGGDGDDDDGEEEEEEEEITEQNVDIGYFVNPEDETKEASKRTKTHEPKLEAFHLRTDMEEGNFDADGNFIRNSADAGAHQDQWLEGLSKSQIHQAKIAHQQREAEEDASQPAMFIPDLLAKLGGLLDVGESPLEALQRLNSQKKKVKRPGNKFRKKTTTDASDAPEDVVKEAARKVAIEEISHYADLLLQRSVSSIYELSREEILREYQKLTGDAYDLKRKRSPSPVPEAKVAVSEQPAVTGTDVAEPNVGSAAPPGTNTTDTAQYEFVWEGSDELHGPYDAATMKSWTEHNYFDARVSVRKVGAGEKFVPYDLVQYPS